MMPQLPSIENSLPKNKKLFYNGKWHDSKGNDVKETIYPGNVQAIDKILQASVADVDTGVKSSHAAFQTCRCNEHRKPSRRNMGDANVEAANVDYFAGLIPMLKGETIPQSEETFHYTIREPLGVRGEDRSL